MGAPKGNKFAVGLTTNGRPPMFKNVGEITIKINEYFLSLLDEEQKEYIERPTITGLALYLGFCSRQSLHDYVKREDFSYIIKRANQVVAMSYEEMLLTKLSTGAIFALKNMGWEDRQSIDQTTIDKTPPNIEFIDED